MHTHEAFSEGLDRAGETTIAFGKKVGVDASTISHLRSGRRKPSLRLAAAIELASRGWPGGAIPATSWWVGPGSVTRARALSARPRVAAMVGGARALR